MYLTTYKVVNTELIVKIKNNHAWFCNLLEQWTMVCGLAWVPSTIASAQMAGLFAGNLLTGQVADIFGRKLPLFGSLLLLLVANLLGTFSPSWLVFGIARTLCGMSTLHV